MAATPSTPKTKMDLKSPTSPNATMSPVNASPGYTDDPKNVEDLTVFVSKIIVKALIDREVGLKQSKVKPGESGKLVKVIQ